MVDRRARRDDVERDAVVASEDREGIRADLVGGVAVRGDPVGSRQDGVDLSRRHQRAGGGICDHGVRNSGRLELPGRQPGALEERSRLVDPDVREQALLPGALERAHRASVTAGREAARVAVRERPRPGAEE